MLKARKLSYDGKGNAVVRSDAEMQVRPLCPLLNARRVSRLRHSCGGTPSSSVQHASYKMTCNLQHTA